MTFELAEGGVGFVSLGRHFPHGDCVWVELMGTRGHARVEVLWRDRGDAVFHTALRAQAEAFARRIRGDGDADRDAGGARGSASATAGDARRALELAALAQAHIQIAR